MRDGDIANILIATLEKNGLKTFLAMLQKINKDIDPKTKGIKRIINSVSDIFSAIHLNNSIKKGGAD